MRPSLLALALALVTACASSKESGRDEVPAAASAQLPSGTQKPEKDEQSPSPGNPSGAATGANAGPPSKPAEALQRSTEPAGPMTQGPAGGSTTAGPMTAAEAAQHLSHDLQGAGGDAGRPAAAAGHQEKTDAGVSGQKSDAGPAPAAGAPPRQAMMKEGDDALSCSADADCSFTRVANGACCPMLCEPRVVAKKHAQALEKQEATCNSGRPCPVAPCRPPRQQQTAVCVEHKCTAKVSRTAIDN